MVPPHERHKIAYELLLDINIPCSHITLIGRNVGTKKTCRVTKGGDNG